MTMEIQDDLHALAVRFCRRHCPDLRESELQDAAGRFIRYVEIILRLHERLKREGRLEEVLERARELQADADP